MFFICILIWFCLDLVHVRKGISDKIVKMPWRRSVKAKKHLHAKQLPFQILLESKKSFSDGLIKKSKEDYGNFYIPKIFFLNVFFGMTIFCKWNMSQFQPPVNIFLVESSEKTCLRVCLHILHIFCVFLPAQLWQTSTKGGFNLFFGGIT